MTLVVINSGPVVALVDHATKGKKHAEKVALRRYSHIVQALYDFSRNKLQQKVSQRFLVNRGVPYDILEEIREHCQNET